MKSLKLFTIIFLVIAFSIVWFAPAIAKVPVSTIELSKLFYRGIPSRIKVPARYGDFSVTHTIIPRRYLDKYFVEFIPKDSEYIYAVWVKADCPEAVAMYRYSMSSETSEYWVYKSDMPVLVETKIYDKKLDNPESWKCLISKRNRPAHIRRKNDIKS